MVADDRFCAQEKANGERRTIEVVDGVVRGINKLGLYVNLPENLIEAFTGFKNAMFDGEQIGTTFHVFDLLSYDRVDLRDRAFGERFEMLVEDVLRGMFTTPDWPIKVLTAAFTREEKAALLAQVKDSNGEGLVFKDVAAPYGAGRSSSVFKYKFKESCTCTVVQANLQRSVQLGLLNSAGDMLAVGNVTIPANFPVPAAGELVEVEYLYFNPEGAFEQPVYLGPRNDILSSEANIGQINRLKPGVSMDDLGRRVRA
jgi:bifunctional non-homologous end joining protein LigD